MSQNQNKMEEIQEFKIEVKRSLRYYITGKKEKADTLIFVLHGFGQLAQFFIRKFDFLPENYLIVAPEGMHRFYLKGNSGRVGASWMTKEARELDIAENTAALNLVHEQIVTDFPTLKIVLLGFSQGGATAARWYYSESQKFNHLILWASVFPPDLPKPKIEIGSTNYFVLGKSDEYYDDKQQQAELENFKEIGFKTIHFEGKHDIQKEVLMEVLESLI